MSFFDFLERGVADAQGEAYDSEPRRDVGETRQMELERRIDRVVLASAAILELLEERHGITSADVRERMRAIDLRDGREDGRISRGLVKCRKCRRENNTRRTNCVYCGTQLVDAPPLS